jgi:hypothetical protein
MARRFDGGTQPGAVRGGREESAFFSQKKNQKTFIRLRPTTPRENG